MGTDEHLFDKIEIKGACLHQLRWYSETSWKSLANYDGLISERISTPNNFLIRTSRGGMKAVEMYKYRKTSRLVLLSISASRKGFVLVINALMGFLGRSVLRGKRQFKHQTRADTSIAFVI